METILTVKKLISGSLSRLLLLVVNVCASFYLMPFVINSLGDRLYGFWIIVGTILGYYGLLDLGLSSAVSRFISQALGQEKPHEINRIMNTAVQLFSFVGLMVILLSLIATGLSHFFIKDTTDVVLFRKVFLLLGCSVAIGFPIRAFMGVLTSRLRHDLISGIELLKVIARTLLIVFFLDRGGGILSLTIITFCVDLVGHVLIYHMATPYLTAYQFSFSKIEIVKIKELFHYGKFTFLAQIGDLFRFKVDSLVIAGFLNLSFVTQYNIAVRLLEIFEQFMVSIIGTITPVFSQLEGQKDIAAIRIWFLQLTKISVAVSLFVGLSILFYGDAFIKRWMGHGYEISYYVLLILGPAKVFSLMQSPSVRLLYGISKHHYHAIANACEGALNLVLSIILVHYYGVYGVALGTATETVFFRLLIQPVFTCRSIQLPLKEYFLTSIIAPSAKIIAPMTIYFYFAKGLMSATYYGIFVLALFQTILLIPVIFFTVFKIGERRFLFSLITKSL